MDYIDQLKEQISSLEKKKIADWDVEEISALALKEARKTFGEENAHNGPGDAYRHILVSAEIARRNGAGTAVMAGYGHEAKNLVDGSPLAEVAMDTHNNRVGREIGTRPETQSWEDVVRSAREKIDQSARQGNGDGENGTAKWTKKTPIEQWPEGWKTAPSFTYPKAGKEHRHVVEPSYSPMGADYKSWSEPQVREVQKTVLGLPSGHPDRDRLDGQVRQWYSHFYGDRSVQYDATGRMIQPHPIRPIPSGGGPVHVEAYDRSQDGGTVHVRSHSRSRPN